MLVPATAPSVRARIGLWLPWAATACRVGLEEYYHVAFRRKLYRSIDELQADLDDWLKQYNHERTHSGKYCFGKTPMQTFKDSIELAKSKLFDSTEQTTGQVA